MSYLCILRVDKKKKSIMKNSFKSTIEDDEMREEYDFSDSKPNKYAAILKQQQRLVSLEADVFKVFNTSDQVNTALRAFINAIPKRNSRKAQKV